MNYLKQLSILNLASPYGIALVPCGIFVLAWAFPPALYTSFIGEQDIVFLSPITIIFFSVCVFAFMLGVRFVLMFRSIGISTSPETVDHPPAMFYLIAPLAIGTLACAVYLAKLGAKVDFMAILSSQQGDMIKLIGRAGDLDEGRWGLSLGALTGILWWAFFRARQFRLAGATKWIYRFFFLAGLATAVVTCAVLVDRTSLMPIFAGIGVISLFWRTRQVSVSISRLMLWGATLAASIIGLFFTLSFLRGASQWRLLAIGLMGYSVASYNRLAALLIGALHYSYEGRGVYLSRFLLTGSVINHIIPVGDRLGWPSTLTLWQTEFASVLSSGLNPAFNWASAFGYLYSDLGWLAPVYMCGVGILAGCFWNSFRRGKLLGIILYPWLSFSVLFWMGTNIIFDFKIVQLLEVTALLWVYDRLALNRVFPRGGNSGSK